MKNKNTYSLLVASQEKGRSIFEGSIFALVILCTAISGWEFASHSVALPRMPATSIDSSAQIGLAAKATVPAPAVADRG